MDGAILHRHDRSARPLRVEHYWSAVNGPGAFVERSERLEAQRPRYGHRTPQAHHPDWNSMLGPPVSRSV